MQKMDWLPRLCVDQAEPKNKQIQDTKFQFQFNKKISKPKYNRPIDAHSGNINSLSI
jgi:hypothetical protein